MQDFLISDILKYWNTIRFLKFKQIYSKLWFLFYRPKPNMLPQLSLRLYNNSWKLSAIKQNSLLSFDNFFFLNQKGSLNKLGWDNLDCAKLWRYHQHYFDDLNAKNSSHRKLWHQTLLKKWIKENPPCEGTGWESYPTSLRIVNWIKWELSDNKLNNLCLQSLTIQCRWLLKRLEWHILGNHLFSNAKALIFAGCFFSGEEANIWLKKGLQIISSELIEQVLDDGGHFERSPMYHSIIAEDLLDLINLAKTYPEIISSKQIKIWHRASIKMLYWLNKMTHPDKEIAFFNDSSIGFAVSPQELFDYAKRLKITFKKKEKANNFLHFPKSGYVKFFSKDVVSFFDVAPIGPDYQPGHAHADTLSFELSLFGHRALVNGGTSEYEAGLVRKSERSTASHNTVVINNENSSEVWSQFRVARRAYPQNLLIKKSKSFLKIRCSHNGYTRLKGTPIHQRTWKISSNNLFIEDQIKGDFKNAYSIFRFHPLVKLIYFDHNLAKLSLGKNKFIFVNIINGKAKFTKDYYAPAFGKRLKCNCLKVFFTSSSVSILFDWNQRMKKII
jgi:uncharacterized heparinase superfamily protein